MSNPFDEFFQPGRGYIPGDAEVAAERRRQAEAELLKAHRDAMADAVEAGALKRLAQAHIKELNERADAVRKNGTPAAPRKHDGVRIAEIANALGVGTDLAKLRQEMETELRRRELEERLIGPVKRTKQQLLDALTTSAKRAFEGGATMDEVRRAVFAAMGLDSD